MIQKKILGIVGQGYVGTAVKEGMIESFPNILHYDKFHSEKSNVENVESLLEKSEIVFICLPTPMKKSGECDTSIIESEISYLNSKVKDNSKILVIKSTVPPGTTESFSKKFKNIKIIFNPEFLTELNYLDDFKNQDRIILGGDQNSCDTLEKIYSVVFPNIPIIKTSSQVAEMIKYFTNTFLATKVTFANQMKLICDNLNIDYDEVVKFSSFDKRLGNSHWMVPGTDKKLGFGGSCFPKDLQALIFLSSTKKIDKTFLESVWNFNLKLRPEKDWEKLKGRAVSS